MKNNTLYENKIINSDDIDRFSTDKFVQTLAITALRRLDTIYPIYLLTRVDQKTGEIPDETKHILNLYKELAENAPVKVMFSVYEPTAHKYAKYEMSLDDKMVNPKRRMNLRLFKHHVTDYNNKAACPNFVSKIRNACLADFNAQPIFSSYGWMFFMEDDMMLHRVIDKTTNEVLPCDDWKMFLIALAIWQYYGVQVSRTYIENSRPVGMVGFPGYGSLCHRPVKNIDVDVQDILKINNTRLTNCVLLNVDQMNKYTVRYETDYDCWDDLDMNLQLVFNAKCNLIAIDYPICMHTTRPMVSDTSNIVYSSGKLNNYCAQMYYKWGNLIRFRGWVDSSGKIYAINSKLPDDFSIFLTPNAPNISYSTKIKEDLRKLIQDSSYINEFIKKYNVR